jgi:hypothetical protein
MQEALLIVAAAVVPLAWGIAVDWLVARLWPKLPGTKSVRNHDEDSPQRHRRDPIDFQI